MRTRKDPFMANILKPHNAPLAVQEQLEQIVKETMGDYPPLSCSCGSCDRGWLSTKMRVQLQGLSLIGLLHFVCRLTVSHTYFTAAAAKILADMMTWIMLFPAPYCQALTDQQVQQDPYIKYIPLGSRTKTSLSFFWGYQDIVNIIHDVLARKATSSIPASDDVGLHIKTLPGLYYLGVSDAQFFLDNGCHVDHVLDCVVDIAEKEGVEDSAWT